jgi:hypothetical protein
MKAVIAVLLAALGMTTAPLQPAAEDPLAPLDRLIGRWQGTTDGRPGKGTVEREYTRILSGRYVQENGLNVYPPQEKNPKGERHEEMGIFSFDRARKRIVFRQFHVERFVTQYVQEPSAAGEPLVFVTEAIENIPAGWRARETYTFINADEFEEVFELAESGKPFEVYSRSRLKRR